MKTLDYEFQIRNQIKFIHELNYLSTLLGEADIETHIQNSKLHKYLITKNIKVVDAFNLELSNKLAFVVLAKVLKYTNVQSLKIGKNNIGEHAVEFARNLQGTNI